MGRILVISALILGFFAWQKHEARERAREEREYSSAVTSNGGDPCTGKKFCALIYLAPWCPACKSQVPLYRDYVEKAKTRGDVGVKVVVGQGRRAGDNEAMAKLFGAAGLVDHDSSYLKKYRVDRFPSLYVLDAERTIILRQEEAFHWLAEKL